MTKPIIMWLYDVKGWAWWNRAVLMSKALPQYTHVFIPTRHYNPESLPDINIQANIVVTPHASFASMIRPPAKTIVLLTSHRLNS